MVLIQYYLLLVLQYSVPAGPYLAVGLQPPSIPTQYVYLPIAPGTDLRPQGPIQYPTPPVPDPGQTRYFRHYHGGRR